jgi:multidrug efflux pump subunit AcrA (membrane-fusion protein)
MPALPFLLAVFFAPGPLAAPGAIPTQAAPAEVKLDRCFVSPVNEARVPAREAGVLLEIPVREGRQASVGDLLARIDDTQAKMAFQVAQFNYQVAQEQARDDVNVRYSTAAAAVAEAEYQQAVEANKRVPNTVPQAEVRRLLLTWRRTQLEIERAQMQLRIAGLEARVKQAEVEATLEMVRRREIASPLEGMVVEVFRHPGEWVQPGDVVMHVVQMNRLRIEGFLNAYEVAPSEVLQREVLVGVRLARGRQETFRGRLVFADPRVLAQGAYRVWVEVENRQEDGFWLLRPGLEPEMTIQLR